MIIYYSLILIICAMAFFSLVLKKKKNRSKVVLYFSSIGIILIQGLRATSVGNDIHVYLRGLGLANGMNFLSGDRLYNFEIGFSLFTQLMARLGINEIQFLFLIAAMIIIPISVTIYKKSVSSSLSIIMYICLGFFTFSFSGIRQSIALAITFYSFKYIEERRFIKFLLLVVLATTFHKTAIIFLPAYFLYPIKIKGKHIMVIFILLALINLFKSRIYSLIYYLYRGYSPIIEDTGAYTLLFIMIAVYVSSFIFDKKKINKKSYIAYQNFLLMAIIVQVFASISNTIMRAGFYYYIFIILLIPEIISKQENRYFRLIATMIAILISLAFFQFQTGSGYLNVSPYRFFWE